MCKRIRRIASIALGCSLASTAADAKSLMQPLRDLAKSMPQASKAIDKGAKNWLKSTADDWEQAAGDIAKRQIEIAVEVKREAPKLAKSDHISLQTARYQLIIAKEMGVIQEGMLRVPGEVIRTAGKLMKHPVVGGFFVVAGGSIVSNAGPAGRKREELTMQRFHPLNVQRYEERKRVALRQISIGQERARSTLSVTPGTNRPVQGSVVSPPQSGARSASLALPQGSSTSNLPKSAGPGGISLSRAAADRLNLNVDFDGALFAEGRIVLSGRPQAGGIDAAMFLTALRLACEPGDPSFSLDADDGKVWTEEGRKLSAIFLDQLRAKRKKSEPREARKNLSVQVYSARIEYAAQWPALLASYPNFKTRLVFRPEWLKETRFGEVLYKADVLLKELTAGAPTVRTDAKLRAGTIDKYLSSDARGAARRLLMTIEEANTKDEAKTWLGHRLWFDLVAQPSGKENGAAERGQSPFVVPSTQEGSQLFKILKQQGYMASDDARLMKTSVLIENGNALDLSQVYPQMFVRRHDLVSREDLPGHDPDLNALSDDVNRRTSEYAAAYKELRDLTDIFRAYIIAAKYAKLYPHACAQIKSMPLLKPEKTDAPLPEYHPSDLYITMASFHGSRRWASVINSSVNGGISLRGKLFSEERMTPRQPTAITSELDREVASNKQESTWASTSGRQYVALNLGPDRAPPVVRQREPVQQQPREAVPTAVLSPVKIGTLGRFDLFEGSRIAGTRLKSAALTRKYAADAKGAMEECMKACSSNDNCVAFEVDQSKDICQPYSTVQRTYPEPNWAHGVWK